MGCDLNDAKVKIANENSLGNSKFICENFFDLSLEKSPDIIIVNDMLHHLDFKHQLKFLIFKLFEYKKSFYKIIFP